MQRNPVSGESFTGRAIAAFAVLLSILGSCARSGFANLTLDADGRRVQVAGDGQERSVTAEWRSGSGHTAVSSVGRVVLAAGDDDVASLSPRGELVVAHRESGLDREMQVRPASGGKLAKTYLVEGQAAAIDEVAIEWWAERLHDIVQHSPIGAAARAERIDQADGPAGLIDAIEAVDDRLAQSAYYTRLQQREALPAELVVRSAEVIARVIRGDSHKREMLSGLAKFADQSEAASVALIDAASTIESGSARADVLEAIANRPSMSVATAVAALRASEAIESNSARSRVLASIAVHAPNSIEVFDQFASAAASITSSTQKAKSIEVALTRRDLDPATYLRLTDVAASIGSSSRAAECLVRIIEVAPTDRDLFARWLTAVGELTTSGGQEAALLKFLERADLDRLTLDRVGETTKAIVSTSARMAVQSRLLERYRGER